MASRQITKAQPPTPPANLTPAEMQAAMPFLEKRIAELKAFEPDSITERWGPQVNVLSEAIERTLTKIFGAHTLEYKRYIDAKDIDRAPMFFGQQISISELRAGYRKGILRSISTLEGIISGFNEEIEHAIAPTAPVVTALEQQAIVRSRSVFVVHGHDDGAREAVARFVEKIGFQAIILHEQANRGRTIIEKVEAHGDVGFAVILLTPDDEGCKKGGTPQPRARQNVLLELGYFIGRLGRENVCAIANGTMELPTDFAGVVWETLDAQGGWKSALGRELEAAGFDIDWNKVMRS